eukprot:510042_1
MGNRKSVTSHVKDEWQCKTCTFIQPTGNSKYCEMCYQPRQTNQLKDVDTECNNPCTLNALPEKITQLEATGNTSHCNIKDCICLYRIGCLMKHFGFQHQLPDNQMYEHINHHFKNGCYDNV